MLPCGRPDLDYWGRGELSGSMISVATRFMTSFQSNEEFFAALRQQIERWCEQRRLRELGLLLPAYTTFFGLTDSWAALSEALKDTRALGRERFSATEWELLNDLILAAERSAFRL